MDIPHVHQLKAFYYHQLQKDDYYTHTKHCTIKHRNNLIEQGRNFQTNFVFSVYNELQKLVATA